MRDEPEVAAEDEGVLVWVDVDADRNPAAPARASPAQTRMAAAVFISSTFLDRAGSCRTHTNCEAALELALS